MGENGAGKSTLLKVLAGILQPDAGEVHWRGERLHLGSPREALERGIGMVYQEMLSFPNLTVAGNIFAGRELTRGGRLRHAEMRERTRAILAELHLAISPDAACDSLSVAHRQLLQVARALAFKCQILVLDEPTTSLTDAEADHLFAVLEKLKAGGVTLLYVSHRLPEVFRLCDRITVLRDGAFVETFERRGVTPDRHRPRDGRARAAAARRLGQGGGRRAGATAAKPVLAVESSRAGPCFTNVTLSVGAGEIVGLFGLVGLGTLGAARDHLRPVSRREAGTIRVNGEPVPPRRRAPRRAPASRSCRRSGSARGCSST